MTCIARFLSVKRKTVLERAKSQYFCGILRADLTRMCLMQWFKRFNQACEDLGRRIPTWFFCLVAAGFYIACLISLFAPAPFNPVLLMIPAVVISLGVLNRLYPPKER